VLLKSIDIMKQFGTAEILPIIIDEIQDPTSTDFRLKVHCMKVIQSFIKDGGAKIKDQLSILAAPLAIASVLDSDYINLVDIALQTLLMLLEDGKNEYPEPNDKAKVWTYPYLVNDPNLLCDSGNYHWCFNFGCRRHEAVV